LLRADIARPTLREELFKLGALVEDVPIYQTRRPAALPEEVLAKIDTNQLTWITFTSASTAENLWQLLTPDRRRKIAQTNRVSIGPITTAALDKLGEREGGEWKPTTTAVRADISSLVQAVIDSVTR
jgi:uroporphyrinogen III methyltransferase/synthase